MENKSGADATEDSEQKTTDKSSKSSAEVQSDVFKTPDEIAAKDDLGLNDPSNDSEDSEPEDNKQTDNTKPTDDMSKKSKRRLFSVHWPPSQKGWAIIGVCILVLAGIAAWLLTIGYQPVAREFGFIKTKPKTVISSLSGLPVDAKVNERPVTAVMIENSLAARPQSGLSQASIVFEAIAEAGITRFMALYQDNTPSNIGPIRSARPYFIQWEKAFDAGYAHVGGSPEALADIRAWKVRDLDQFYNSGSYHRVSTREAPHNVYTSVDALIKLQQSKGWNKSTFTSIERKKRAIPSKKPNARHIDLTLSGPWYDVHYDYNPKYNSYNRNEGGKAHVDANGKRRISPSVVIAMVTPYRLESDGYHSDYQVVGSGRIFVFQNGRVEKGKWTKKSNTAQIVLTDSAGKPLLLNPGQAWFTAISDVSKLKFKP